jgi:acyl-CoA reductase-like NAD-dependent aldehyde dehydrogenase
LAMQALSVVSLLEAFEPLAENHSLEEKRKGLRGGAVIVRKAPVGVSVGIAPWNAPVFLCCVRRCQSNSRSSAYGAARPDPSGH